MTDDASVRDSIEHLFRQHTGQMIAVLTRIFGIGRIDVIDDSVQDALVTALRRWPFTGVPENPRAWLIQVAKNKVIDVIRASRRFDALHADDLDELTAPADATASVFKDEIEEDQLRLIFACCHPAISPDSQVALTLKIVGGFGVGEIARAYLSKPDAVAKILSRAKRRLREPDISLELPSGSDLADRTDAVLRVLYLMFNEGYGAAFGDRLLREDLCFEAIRLIEVLSVHPVSRSPKVHAAAGLFLFQASRLPARAGQAGELIPLGEQDRTVWDRRLIARAVSHFRLSAAGNELSSYHLEAEIAAIYTLAPSHSAIDWQRILECYDALQSRGYSAIVELNRIIVIGQIEGPGRAIAELKRIAESHGIRPYNLFYVTKAHFLEQAGQADMARIELETALSLTENGAVQRFIESRIAAL